ncbi:MAG: LysM peptidoglycan-binding domain-containing protein [Anaerolineae bacterium]|nr:LysM peptidoglycan-binding domain-containing protein [Anaerolineae bacterium]
MGTETSAMSSGVLSRSGRRYLLAALILFLGFGFQFAALSSHDAAAQEDGGQIYIVQHDDTLWKVAAKYLGDGNEFGQIVAATNAKHSEDPDFAFIQDPGLIRAGSRLWIPAPIATLPTGEATGSASPALPASIVQDAPQPTAPGGSETMGKIAFSFWNDSPGRCTYEINVIDVDACLAGAGACQSNRRILALNNASEPALSPDGTRLAFRGWGEIPEKYKDEQVDHPYFNCAQPRAERHLGHTNLDGTNYQGTTIFWEDAHPDWSPDGTRLLFDTGRNGDGITRIMAVSADGQSEDELRLAGQQPAWAPDGERFVYRGCDQTGNRCGLWLAKAIPVQAWDLGLNMIGPLLEEAAAAQPDWSPAADQIVYQSPAGGSWDLYVIKTDGSEPRRLTDDPGIEGLPAWSPDGEWVAYLSDAGGGWGIWLIRANGSERQQLFRFDGGIFTPLAIEPYPNRDWLDEQISWSK